MKTLNLLHAVTCEEWRSWLAEHHATVTEVWLVFAKKHTGKPRISYDDAVEEALCFGWIDSIVRKLDEDSYAQKFTPRKDHQTWSAPNLERMKRLIAGGRMTAVGLAKFEPGPETPPPRHQTGDAVPAFIEEALRAAGSAWTIFSALAPSHRRNYVRWITEAKKEETRQRRLRDAIGRLERGETLGLK